MGNAVVAVLQRVDDCRICRLNRRHRNGFHGHDEDVFVQDVVVFHVGTQRQRHGSPSAVEEDRGARNSLHRELRVVQPFDELGQRTLNRFPSGRDMAPLDDTMLMSYALDAGRGAHGMDALAERHLKHSCMPFTQVLEHAPGAKKSDKTFAQVPLDKATEYSGEDADVTLRLWMALKPRLVAERVATVYETLERPMVCILGDMERTGIKVDKAILSRLSSTFAQRVARLEEEIYELAGHKINLGSPKQLGEFLFDNLKLPGGRKTKTGQWETRANLLDDLAASEELPEAHRKLINVMLEWRQLTKLMSTYTELAAAAHQSPRRVASTRAMRSPRPPPAGSPPPIPTCRTSRSGPRKGARSARPSSPSAATSSSPPTTARSSCACWPTSPTSRS